MKRANVPLATVEQFGNGTTMRNRPQTVLGLMLVLALAGCARKPADGCRQHTGDGLCADPGKDVDGKPLP